MDFIGDFHIHSHYSIATSKLLKPEYLDAWARVKGIAVIGTGDITHPGWLSELEEKLEADDSGLLHLKPAYRLPPGEVPEPGKESPDWEGNSFILTGEISSIYKKGEKVRKVHSLVMLPDFEAARRFQQELGKIGNITSDGRPILGFDPKDLLDMVLNLSDHSFFIPAHIWTPWFSVLGAKSGFDTIEECFEELTPHIHAVETGLSSDPPMNWLCRFLDRFSIVSNSDAHSPEKLGREANLFSTDRTYLSIIEALKGGVASGLRGTIEFFPQEGKYHFDGHRKCGCRMDPLDSLKAADLCPRCGKKMTIGVLHRVAQLADRNSPSEREERLPFYSLIPLKEILAEIADVGPGSKKVAREYASLIHRCGTEFSILHTMPLDELGSKCGEVLREAVRRMRDREVYIEEGYDGEFGSITVFTREERRTFTSTTTLFPDSPLQSTAPIRPPPSRPLIPFDMGEFRRRAEVTAEKPELSVEIRQLSLLHSAPEMSEGQQEAVEYRKGPLIICAGPGSGKTRTIAFRALSLIKNREVAPQNLLILTFTNKAAGELRDRLSGETARLPCISTFHALGLSIIREFSPRGDNSGGWVIIDEKEQTYIRKHSPAGSSYNRFLTDHNLLDFESLISLPVRFLETHEAIRKELQERYVHIMVDEFQDINRLQYRFLRLLKPDGTDDICIIGDPNQSIYGFRGGDPALFDTFSHDYPDRKLISLDTSYRCPSILLEAATQVVGKEESNGSSRAFAPAALRGLTKGLAIHLSDHPTARNEAEFIARTIEDMIGGLRFFSLDSAVTAGEGEEEIKSLADIAVLCRTSHQMEDLEKAFNDHAIPYQRVDTRPFSKTEPASSLLSLLQLVLHRNNSFLREMAEQTIQSSGKLDDVLEVLTWGGSISDRLETAAHFLPPDWRNAIDLCKEAALPFGTRLEAYISSCRLGTVQDDYVSAAEQVALMTLHAAKGLEWHCVFIPGCEEGLLPFSLFENQQTDPAEERRLFYVGITRSKKHLYLTTAGKRTLFHRQVALPQSPFLSDIEDVLKEEIDVSYAPRIKDDAGQLELF